jgi:hypothetical protein
MWFFSDLADWWDEKKRETSRYLHEFGKRALVERWERGGLRSYKRRQGRLGVRPLLNSRRTSLPSLSCA